MALTNHSKDHQILAISTSGPTVLQLSTFVLTKGNTKCMQQLQNAAPPNEETKFDILLFG